MTADRVAASAAEVGVILAISDQHVRDSIDELAALGAPAVSWTKMRELVPELRTVKMHHLRHRAATMLIAAGIPVTVAADRLGHSPQTLLRTYTHPTADLGSAAASVTALS
jgi:integrase